MQNIYQQNWMILSKEVRNKLAEIFKINRTAITEVRDDTVICDGYSNTDLSVITLEKMQEYTGEVGSFGAIWELTLKKIELELHPELKIEEPTVVEIPIVLEEGKTGIIASSGEEEIDLEVWGEVDTLEVKEEEQNESKTNKKSDKKGK